MSAKHLVHHEEIKVVFVEAMHTTVSKATTKTKTKTKTKILQNQKSTMSSKC
jgi:hypothetical protein